MKEVDMRLKVGVIIGGRSVEHDISILSGLQVYHALDSKKYQKTLIYLTKENEMLIGSKLTKIETYQKNDFKNCQKIRLISMDNQVYYQAKRKKIMIDLFIPVVHGEGVEDGTLAAILDSLKATYVTSDLISSGVAQDKIFAKAILRNYNINVAKDVVISDKSTIEENFQSIIEKLKLPVIIKPARLGSSIGITKANNEEEIKKGLLEAMRYTNRIITEEIIGDKADLKEYNCAAFYADQKVYISAIEEVISEKDFLSFVDKYTKPLNKLDTSSNRIIPAVIDESLEQLINETTKKIYQILNMRGVVRIDYLYSEKENKLYFNEINAIPGSYAFYLFDKVKIDFTTLLDKLIKQALLETNQKQSKLHYFNSNVLEKKGLKLNQK